MLFLEKLEEEYTKSVRGPDTKKASIHTLDTWVRFAIEAENCEMFLQKIQKENTDI